ncbi:Crp/Fnr family transcriptional regulator [Erythrobacter litoralis]|uniref:Transcriptional activator protein FnrL n=1 Tax=Erythrobacter litoralis (strain HTCC2594) TaxID=314225 RepID=Q2NCD9_ERYLH|nr:Crp/Fnr family transcriptional regulator [Erythrobacter litoralis]ABC62652.1 transcriptional activator protein FnrL [Erythrobacter litoralis HTCC2594]
MNLACASCPVRERAACAVLTEAERGELARAGRTVKLKRGEMLFAAGDEDHACATLLRGALKVSAVDREGEERILALIHPAGFVGELFQPFAHHDVVALTDCELCVFARREMEAALERHPALARAMLRRSQDDLHAARELLELTGKQDAATRLAGLIMAMARAASDSPCHPSQAFDLPLTRGEMAQMLGLTIETVSRRMSKFEKDGLIAKKGARGIELVDPARLEALVGVGL